MKGHKGHTVHRSHNLRGHLVQTILEIFAMFPHPPESININDHLCFITFSADVFDPRHKKTDLKVFVGVIIDEGSRVIF